MYSWTEGIAPNGINETVNKMSYESIKAEINNLKVDASETEMEALNELHNQFDKAGNASWTKDELTTELKQDNDVLDSFEQDAAFYEDVRSIQDSIISFFGE